MLTAYYYSPFYGIKVPVPFLGYCLFLESWYLTCALKLDKFHRIGQKASVYVLA